MPKPIGLLLLLCAGLILTACGNGEDKDAAEKAIGSFAENAKTTAGQDPESKTPGLLPPVDNDSEAAEKAALAARRREHMEALARERAMRPQPAVSLSVAERLLQQREEALRDLASEDAATRQEALRFLDPTQAADRRAIETALSQDPSAEVRQAAAEALSLGQAPESIPSLTQALEDPYAGVVTAALESLAWFDGHPEVVERLQRLKKHHPNKRVRKAAETALDMLL